MSARDRRAEIHSQVVRKRYNSFATDVEAVVISVHCVHKTQAAVEYFHNWPRSVAKMF
jgi:hypothetical protein